MAQLGTNNLSDLTGFFNGFNKDTAVQKELSEQTNEKLVGIGKSFKADAKLQKKLVKWSKIDMGMDVAAFVQDSKSKELLEAKRTSDIDDAKMDAKVEEHGSINNDLLARIEIVLVTRLDRILDGIKLMLPGRFKGSEFGPKDFGEAVKKSQDISNSFLKDSIDDLRFERYTRKNQREKEEIASLRRQGKTKEANEREKKRKEKELRLEGFNPDGSLLRKEPRGYHFWKDANQDRKDVGPTEYRGNLTGKMSTSSSKMSTSSSSSSSSSKMSKMSKMGIVRQGVNSMGLKLLNFTKSIGKLFLKTGLFGILVYSIMPLFKSLNSEETKKKLKSLKTSLEDLWIKVEPIVTFLDRMFTDIGKTVGGWLGKSIMTIMDTFVDIFDGLGMLFEGDIVGAFKTIFFGKDGKGGIINMVNDIILDAVESVWTLIKKWVEEFDVGSEISRMLIALKPDPGSFWPWGEDEKQTPKKSPLPAPREQSAVELESKRQLAAVIAAKNAQMKIDNAAAGYNELNYNKQGDVYNTLVPPSQPRFAGLNDSKWE
jgi:hypothetical protein